MIVIDATALLELLMLTPAGVTVADRIFERPAQIHAPEQIDLEVTQAVRRYVRLGDVSDERADALFEDLTSLRMRRHSHQPLLQRIWQLRENLTAYDACYVALAEGLDATLITRDRAVAAAPHRARVEVV